VSAPSPTTQSPAWPTIAHSLAARGELGGAAGAWRKALADSPAAAVAWSGLGTTLIRLWQPVPARHAHGRAASLHPSSAEAQFNLAAASGIAGDGAAAARAFRRGLALAPPTALAHNQFGHLGVLAGRIDIALTHLARAVALDPCDAMAWTALADHLLGQLVFSATERSLRRAIVAAPGSIYPLLHFANLLRDLGEPAAALRWFDRIAAIGADEGCARRSLLLLLYHPELSAAERFARHRAYAAAYAPPLPRPAARPAAGRRRHIGYLSAGFFDHPTAAVTAGLLERHDRSAFEITLFAHVGTPDAMSLRLKGATDRWVDVHGMPAAAIAETIRAAGFDILVLLAGRYDPVAWPVAALRPAPVQIAFHDTASSGLDAIDHLVTDAVLSPRRSAEPSTERLLRLPSLPLHALPADAPPVAPLPALAAGHVTFGSLNSSAKLNDRVLRLWGRVMMAVPTARLLIKAPGLASPRLAGRVLARLAEAGVDRARVELVSGYADSLRDMLRIYERIDIGLDTFPYAGGMTSFEAMCQGVPVVTLADRDMVGRWGATLAIHAGHPELVAETEQAYVGIARRLAADLPGLGRLRARLRSDFLASPLSDARLKARHLERAYRRMCR
jgi:Flp pilus assembly protein TadD